VWTANITWFQLTATLPQHKWMTPALMHSLSLLTISLGRDKNSNKIKRNWSFSSLPLSVCCSLCSGVKDRKMANYALKTQTSQLLTTWQAIILYHIPGAMRKHETPGYTTQFPHNCHKHNSYTKRPLPGNFHLIQLNYLRYSQCLSEQKHNW